jgi:hypothetical protein
MKIVLSRFLSVCRILQNGATNYIDALKFFMEKEQENADAVVYNQTTIFKLREMRSLNRDNHGNIFFEISVNRDGDIVDNFTYISKYSSRIHVTYYVGGVEFGHRELDEFVLAAAAYENFVVRITFLQTPGEDEEIKIILRYYILSLRRRLLLKKNTIITRSCYYGLTGQCQKYNHTDKTL